MKTSKPRTQDQSGTRTGPTRTRAKNRPAPGLIGEHSRKTASFAAARELRNLVSQPDTPAAAKVNALRALAEIEGLIGRFQGRPTKAQDAPLSTLSRDELVAELARLREAIGLGLIG
jgi:hypothetical protein